MTTKTTRREATMNFEIYSDNGGRFHWRLDGDDGKPLAVSSAAFATAEAARVAAQDVHAHAGAATGADAPA